MFKGRGRRVQLEARIAAARARADEAHSKVDTSDDEYSDETGPSGPGWSQGNDIEHHFDYETYHDRRELFQLDNARLFSRARARGVEVPADLFDSHAMSVDEFELAEFRQKVNAAQFQYYKDIAQIVTPIFALFVAAVSALVTYSGNRRYNALEALMNERTARLEVAVRMAADDTTALRVRVEQLASLAEQIAKTSPRGR